MKQKQLPQQVVALMASIEALFPHLDSDLDAHSQWQDEIADLHKSFDAVKPLMSNKAFRLSYEISEGDDMEVEYGSVLTSSRKVLVECRSLLRQTGVIHKGAQIIVTEIDTAQGLFNYHQFDNRGWYKDTMMTEAELRKRMGEDGIDQSEIDSMIANAKESPDELHHFDDDGDGIGVELKYVTRPHVCDSTMMTRQEWDE